MPDRPEIQLVLPPNYSVGGNRTTAERWARWLSDFGFLTEITQEISFSNNNVQRQYVFFNAFKSWEPIQRLEAQSTNARYAVVLSGTDVNGHHFDKPETRSVLHSSCLLVAYESSTVMRLPADLRKKTMVVPHSTVPSNGLPHDFGSGIHVITVGHVRAEKNLVRYFKAVRQFNAYANLSFHHVGGIRDEEIYQAIVDVSAHTPNLTLHGEQPFGTTLAMIRGADVLVHPSHIEGFPNVLVEAVVHGTPIMISRIAVHWTTFQNCQPPFECFFDVDCGQELKQLIHRYATDEKYRQHLASNSRQWKMMFAPEKERDALLQLVDRLTQVRIKNET